MKLKTGFYHAGKLYSKGEEISSTVAEHAAKAGALDTEVKSSGGDQTLPDPPEERPDKGKK